MVVGTFILIAGLAILLLWLKRGRRYADATAEWMVLGILALIAAVALTIGIALDDQLPSALVQIASAMVAGVFVGVVILVLGRRE